jgi:hypothetical protein
MLQTLINWAVCETEFFNSLIEPSKPFQSLLYDSAKK